MKHTRSDFDVERGYGTRLVVIRLIRAIRGLNILSFQLQNHSTSLMPIRVIEATERIARKKAECARRSVSFMSAYSNAFTLSFPSVKIRVLRFNRVLFLPNNSTIQFTLTSQFISSAPRLCARSLFNQKSSASDIFNIDLRLTTVEFWSAPAWRSFLSQSALSALSLTE